MEKAHATENHSKRTLHKRSAVPIDMRNVSTQAERYVNDALRFARERPGMAIGVAFGAGMIFGGSIANRLVRLAVYSALGAGIQALLREAPAWLKEAQRESHVS
jgi:hypothetical protein